jgi:hypothetical protein
MGLIIRFDIDVEKICTGICIALVSALEWVFLYALELMHYLVWSGARFVVSMVKQIVALIGSQ